MSRDTVMRHKNFSSMDSDWWTIVISSSSISCLATANHGVDVDVNRALTSRCIHHPNALCTPLPKIYDPLGLETLSAVPAHQQSP